MSRYRHQPHLLSTLVRAQVEAQFCLKMKPWGHLFQNWGDLIELKSTLCASFPDQTLPCLSSSPLSGLSWAGTRHTSSLHCLTLLRRFASQRNPKSPACGSYLTGVTQLISWGVQDSKCLHSGKTLPLTMKTHLEQQLLKCR